MASGCVVPLTVGLTSSAGKSSGTRDLRGSGKGVSGKLGLPRDKEGFHKLLESNKAEGGSGGKEPVKGNSKAVRKEGKGVEGGQKGERLTDTLMGLFSFFQQLIQSGLITQDELNQWLSNKLIPLLKSGEQTLESIIEALERGIEEGKIVKDVSTLKTVGGGEDLGETGKNPVLQNMPLEKLEERIEAVLKGLNSEGETSADLEKALTPFEPLRQTGIFEEKALVDKKSWLESGIVDAGKRGKSNTSFLGGPEDIQTKETSLLLKEVVGNSGGGKEAKRVRESREAFRETDLSPATGFLKVADSLDLKVSGGGKREIREPQPLSVVDQIIQAVSFSRKDGQYMMRVALNPPELGHVNVSLTVKGHHVQAVFVVENAATHGILSHQLPELQALLAHQGLTVHDVSVQIGGGNPQGFQAFGERAKNFSDGMTWRGKGLGERGTDRLEEPMAVERGVQKVGDRLLTSMDRINIFA